MNKGYMYSIVAVVVMFLVGYIGTQKLGLQPLFGVILPYTAFAVFIFGVSYKVLWWAKSAVPFRITTTCGQQRSLNWIKSSTIENPSSRIAVIIRMLLEIFCFRSLFRNTYVRLDNNSNRVSYKLDFFLWFVAILFHYSFFVVVFRHLRFFINPIPVFVTMVEKLDSFFKLEILYDFIQFGLPGVFLSGFVLLFAIFFLFLRRIYISRVRYISLSTDYFPLFLIFGIAISGICMRYFVKTDVVAVKKFTMGLLSLSPTLPIGVGGLFYSHLFLVCILLFYFPFSKLMHAGGVLLTPTRNMTANTREIRHINPWNYPVKVHTYEEYEDDFREKMLDVGIPIDKLIVKQPNKEG